MEDVEYDELAHLGFLAVHRVKIHSTNTLEG